MDLLRQIIQVVGGSADRTTKVGQLADVLRRAGPYRWVGLYDVTTNEIAVVAWSGAGAPSYPRFPRDRGLCGAAVSVRRAILVGDVAKDPRYLTTFGSTRSEIVVPVLHPSTGEPVGLIDVESERVAAFTDDDRALFERCAMAMADLWPTPHGAADACC